MRDALRACAIVVGMSLVVAACGGGDGAATPAGEAPSARVALAPHAQLAALLPEVDGWTRTPPEAVTLDLPAPASHAAATYSRDGALVDLEITDTAGQAEYLEATMKIAGTAFERTSENGYFRGATISGSPAVESWNHIDRLAEITVVVAGRFVIHSTGSGLSGIEDLRAMVEQIAFDRLAALTPR